MILYAQPYDVSATGFYFESHADYEVKAKKLVNAYGQPVEEFEIQFIDGDELDCELVNAIGVHQANLKAVFNCVDLWGDDQKRHVIIAVGQCGYVFDPDQRPEEYGVDIYSVESLKELAEQFVEDGLYGDIPDSLRFYIDTDAIARDLAVEFSEITIAGEGLVYACR